MATERVGRQCQKFGFRRKARKARLTLTSSQSTNHDQTSTHTSEETLSTQLASHLDQATSDGLAGESLGLVDLAEQGISGLGDDGGGETGDETGAQVQAGESAGTELGLGLAGGVDKLFEGDLKHAELGHGVRHLLEEDGTEAGVEALEALLPSDASEAASETAGEGWLRDETDTGSF